MLNPAFVRLAREAPYLVADEERDLIVKAQAGDAAARERIVVSHLRYVISEAIRRSGYNVPIGDLVQEGSEGMVEALNRFDVSRPVRFSTYAGWWIRSRMNDAAMRDHSIVRRNTTQADKDLFFKLRTARAALERDGRRTRAEIDAKLAAGFGVSVSDIVEMTAYLCLGDNSLNAPVRSGLGEEVGEAIDLLADTGPGPDALVEGSLEQDMIASCIERAMLQLTSREATIIRGRIYAADPDQAMTLDQLGARLGVTRERVRQIELRALRKMGQLLAADGIGPDFFVSA